MNREEIHALWAKVHAGTAMPEEQKLLFDTVNANRAIPPSPFVDAKPIATQVAEIPAPAAPHP